MLEDINPWNLIAGLGVFLFGMMCLEEGLQNLSSHSFRRLLRKSTQNPVSSVCSGVITTAIVQSSSMVSLMVLALVGAGIIPLYNAIGVVIGANLGTTFTGWVVTTLGFKMQLSTIALPMIGAGYLLQVMLSNKTKYKLSGQILMGFGMLIFGLDLMKESIESITHAVDLEELRGWSPLTYLIVGVIFTAIIQSSSASMMITLSALNAGIIDLQAAAALVIGADLGTTSTTALGALKGSIVKKQVAMSHVLFNLVVDTLAFLILLPLLPELMSFLQLQDPLYSLVAFHSFFNLAGVLLFLPLLQRFSHLLGKMFTDDEEVRKYIQHVPANMTEEALIASTKETDRILLQTILINLINLNLSATDISPNNHIADAINQALPKDLSFKEKYSRLKTLEGELLEFAAEIHHNTLHKHHSEKLNLLLQASRSAVYSAKNLKDIRDNLETFHNPENLKNREHYLQLMIRAKDFYRNLLIWYSEQENTSSQEHIRNALMQLNEVHHSFKDWLYKESSTNGINKLQSSTLLNVNLELLTSCRGLVDSLRNFKNTLKLIRY